MTIEPKLTEYLYGHIPYRLQALRFCYRICDVRKEPHPDYGDELWIGEGLNLDEDRRLWFNAVIESGLIYCRVLLEFLGITRDRDADRLMQTDSKQMKRKRSPDDICITDFGLSKITVEQAVSGFSYASPDKVAHALCHIIETANKTVAHLTAGPKLPGTFPSLRLACRVVIDLLWQYLYVPLTGSPLLKDPLLERPLDLRIREND
jgi:hypothetical protein